MLRSSGSDPIGSLSAARAQEAASPQPWHLLPAIAAVPVYYGYKNQINAEQGKACTAAGGNWIQNANEVFECRR